MIGLFIPIFFSVIYVLSAYTDEENEESLLDLMLKVTRSLHRSHASMCHQF